MGLRGWAIAGVIVTGLGYGLWTAVERTRESAARANCALGQLGVAFHNYADVNNGRLPPAAVCDKDGKPLLSWRVLLLPYIEEKKLFDEFRLDESWDSEHNLKLLPRMPRTYEARWKKVIDVPEHHTVLRVFVGPGAAFEWNRGLSLTADFPDGTANTLLYVESGPPVPWTKPDEIAFDPNCSIQLRGLFRDGGRSGTVDGSGYKIIRNDCDPQLLRASITRNGGERDAPVWNH
jgi:hypothetical protein